jgi:monoamine oxidase
MADVDILIIGAGAAGIAAGRTLAQSKLCFLLLEARDRLGGRALTKAIDGMAIDLGCGWLHSADRNPWAPIAQHEFTIDTTPPAWRTQFADLGFTPAEQKEAQSAFAAFRDRLEQAPPSSDCAADAIDPQSRWNCYLEALSGFMNGASLHRLSVSDFLAYDQHDSGVNWRVREGYGALIASEGEALPVRLGVEARRLEWSGHGVKAHTSHGMITASAAIIAVPTTVLAREMLRFEPPLPDKIAAAASLPLGLANKAFLALDRPEPFEPDTQLLGSPYRSDTGAYFLRPFGLPLIECFFGGAGAIALEAEGEGAAADFGIEQLVALLGSNIRKRLAVVAETRWGRDAFAGGSYSHALPGRSNARAELARPVEGCIFFAGEACSPTDFSTAHGAYESGVRAALDAMKGLRERTRGNGGP